MSSLPSLTVDPKSLFNEEIYGLIIDFSSPDDPTMQDVSLVSKLFEVRSRKYRFSKFVIRMYYPEDIDIWKKWNQTRLEGLQKDNAKYLHWMRSFIVYTDSQKPQDDSDSRLQIIAMFVKLLAGRRVNFNFTNKMPENSISIHWRRFLGVEVKDLQAFLCGVSSLRIDYPFLISLEQHGLLPNTLQELTVRLPANNVSTAFVDFHDLMGRRDTGKSLAAIKKMNVEFETAVEAYHTNLFEDNGAEQLNLEIRTNFGIDFPKSVDHGLGTSSALEDLDTLLTSLQDPFQASSTSLVVTIHIIVPNSDSFEENKLLYSKHFGCACWQAMKEQIPQFASVRVIVVYAFNNESHWRSFVKSLLPTQLCEDANALFSPLGISKVEIVSSKKRYS